MSYREIYKQYQTVFDLVFKTSAIIFDETLVEDVTVKGVADFVTEVDLRIESFLKENLRKAFPSAGFISEEQKENVYDKEGSCFILDPIDGTTNLIHHYQHSAVSLALCEMDEIVFGIVYNPFTRETFTAAKGKGAYLNERPIKVSGCYEMEKALITLGTAPYNKELAGENFPMFERIFKKCADIRISGSAALDICYIASGRLEAYAERNLKPWDFAAASLILTEAGGEISNWDNQKIPFDNNSKILASNGILHQAVRTVMVTQAVANNGFPFEIKRNITEYNPYAPITEEEMLMKLEISRKHANQGKYRNADEVVSDMRARYEL